jgi:uncharacterized delta-60 repeat protein
MRKIHLATGILSVLIYSLLSSFATAATDIDTSFGVDGYTLQDFEIGDDEAYAIAVQEDGKILVAGYSSNGAVKDLIVSRFSEDGTLDTDFNAAGVFSTSLGNGDTIGRSLVILEDGSIIVGGISDNGSSLQSITVLKLTSTGYLDDDFASYGHVELSEVEGDIDSTELQLTDGNEIIVAATISPDESESYAYFAKLDTSGKLAPSFGSDGETTYTDDTNDVQVNSILVQSDGTILAGGSFNNDGTIQAGLLKLTASGVVDTSYGSEGALTLDLGDESSVINSIAAGSDDDVIVAGALNDGEYDEAFIGKIDEDGSVLTDFGTSGTYTTTYSIENVIYDVSVNDDDSISAVGFITSDTSKDIFVLTLQEDTDTLTTAATLIVTDIDDNDDVAYAALAVDSDTLLTAGSSSNGDNLDVVLLRFTSDESLVSSSATDSTDGITTSGFRITTQPVSAITRVSALSGGTIQQLDSTSELTISQKGVVYGTTSNPEYSEDDDSDTTDDSSDTTDDTDSTDSTDSDGSVFPDSNDYYIVREGSTNDGDGTESYTSNVEDITPGTTYYLRAYAVLSDDTIIYGNEYRFSTDDACFIATAAFGSIFEKHVVLLRQFRDSYLLTNSIGEQFVAIYYHFSPPIADIIRDSNMLKFLVKIGLFPAILLASFMVKTSLITKILCLGAGLTFILLAGIKYFTFQKVKTT